MDRDDLKSIRKDELVEVVPKLQRPGLRLADAAKVLSFNGPLRTGAEARLLWFYANHQVQLF